MDFRVAKLAGGSVCGSAGPYITILSSMCLMTHHVKFCFQIFEIGQSCFPVNPSQSANKYSFSLKLFLFLIFLKSVL